MKIEGVEFNYSEDEINPQELLCMIGFVFSFTDNNPIHPKFSDIGVKRIAGFNFYISGSIQIFLSEPDDYIGGDGDYYEFSNLSCKPVPGGHQRQMSLPYFTVPPEFRSDEPL